MVMYVVRDIFHLKFGHYKDAQALLNDANEKNLLPEAKGTRVLTDFTGDSYRLIIEETFKSLADYEESLNSSMRTDDWKDWYNKFKDHVHRSHREILNQIM